MAELTKFDYYLKDDGPAALVIREHLMPVEGADGVLFPATFAAGDNFPGGYNIDNFEGSLSARFTYEPPGAEKLESEVRRDPAGRNVCLVDSVGSQANRIEPLFKEDEYRHLVPQIVVKAGEKEVSILEAGHRAGDALVRCSSLKEAIDAAFLASIRGDAEPLAKIAPTSLVFGVWNSRGEKGAQERRPRLVSSTIRAFNVRKLTRSAVYTAPVDYPGLDIFSDEDRQKAEGDSKNPLSKRGFVNALASGTHGGVIAEGGVRRDATLGLAALRLLFSGKDVKKTLALRRYILGLSLVAFTYKPGGYLRQGCLLVLDPGKANENEFVEVHPTGERKPLKLKHEEALDYATEAAKAFGVGASQTVPFDKDRAKKDVKGEEKKGGKGKSKPTEGTNAG